MKQHGNFLDLSARA